MSPLMHKHHSYHHKAKSMEIRNQSNKNLTDKLNKIKTRISKKKKKALKYLIAFNQQLRRDKISLKNRTSLLKNISKTVIIKE